MVSHHSERTLYLLAYNWCRQHKRTHECPWLLEDFTVHWFTLWYQTHLCLARITPATWSGQMQESMQIWPVVCEWILSHNLCMFCLQTTLKIELSVYSETDQLPSCSGFSELAEPSHCEFTDLQIQVCCETNLVAVSLFSETEGTHFQSLHAHLILVPFYV